MTKNEICVIVGIAVFIVVYITIWILALLLSKKRCRIYADYLEENYKEKGIYDSLNDLKEMYSKKSDAYICIDKALFYMDNSIGMDYATAFNIIEQIFRDERVKKIDKEILDTEKEKVKFLLEVKN